LQIKALRVRRAFLFLTSLVASSRS
jgi:hypothetical protein